MSRGSPVVTVDYSNMTVALQNAKSCNEVAKYYLVAPPEISKNKVAMLRENTKQVYNGP